MVFPFAFIALTCICKKNIRACEPPITAICAVARQRSIAGHTPCAHGIVARAVAVADNDGKLGHTELLCALTILAPSLMIPPCSLLDPTIKPVTSCRNTSVFSLLQFMIKRAGLISRIRIMTPPNCISPFLVFTTLRWLATILHPNLRYAQAADDALAVFVLVLIEFTIINEAIDHLVHVVLLDASVGINP